MPDYSWQTALYDKWKERGFIGICRAVTSAGKTRAGVIALRRYMDEHPDAKAIILSPSQTVSKSWAEELESQAFPHDVEINTYQKAVNAMRRNDIHYDVMIADECHRLRTPAQGRVLDMNPTAILGLSATPEEAVQILGEPFMEITMKEANVCDFTIHYTFFEPSGEERTRYDKATDNMVRRALEVSDGTKRNLPPGRDSVGWNSYDALARKRREVCYLMPSRIPHTLNLIIKNLGRRTVVYFERVSQVSEVSKRLDGQGIPHAVHTQERSTFDEFESHDVDILLACKSLREGWNDPTIECVIMGSISTRSIVNTQTIGRALRINPAKPDKHSDIYLLIAEGTSDVNVTSNLKYPKENITEEDIRNSKIVGVI